MKKKVTITLHPMQRQKFIRIVRTTKDAKMKLRYQIILNYDQGMGSGKIAQVHHSAHSTPWRVACRFQRLGEAGLIDGRTDNGSDKLDESCYIALARLLEHGPPDYGWERPTWTLELLAKQLQRGDGILVSTPTVSRMLDRLGARKGSPRPTVRCPWSRRRRERQMRVIHQMIDNLAKDELAFWEDEVDIHLNPKIGPDWMLPGRQKTVITPGINKKHYLAGVLDVHTGAIHYVESEHKRSALFIDLVRSLVRHNPKAKKIHLLLDNFVIHTSKMTQTAIEEFGGRVQLHFLPPYDPNDNRIERLWRDLHDNVTRNHRCKTMQELLDNVHNYVRSASPFPGSKPSQRRVA